MTSEDNWKPNLLLGLFSLAFLTGSVFIPDCNGQGSNFYYYFSPTQGTGVFQTTEHGQIFSNPLLNQQQQVGRRQSNFQFPQVGSPSQQEAPASQRPQPLGYQQQTPASTFFTQSPLGNFQFQFPPQRHQQQPLESHQSQQQQQQQQQYLQPTTPAFSTFTRLGNIFNNQQFGIPQQTISPFQQQPQQQSTIAPQVGTYSFFENPFQYIQQQQQRHLNTIPVPTTQSVPVPTSTLAPPPESNDDGRPPKFSSRFRYVQQPQQYNPYTRVGTPYTSELPYSEQRYYTSSAPSSSSSPAGYSFTIGGDGNGPRASVHVSMGSVNHIQQHLTEITQNRRLLQRQRPTPIPETDSSTSPIAPEAILSKNDESSSQSTPAPPVTSSTTQPEVTSEPSQPMSSTEGAVLSSTSPPTADVLEQNGNGTMANGETLQNEPSFTSEAIAAPDTIPTEVATARKVGQVILPSRRIIRKKISRKPLRPENIETNPTSDDTHVANRANISPNRLPPNEQKDEGDQSPKGLVESPPVENLQPPSSTETITTSTTTTTQAPELIPEQMIHDEIPQEPMPSPPTPEPITTTTTATTTTTTSAYPIRIPGPPQEQEEIYEYYDDYPDHQDAQVVPLNVMSNMKGEQNNTMPSQDLLGDLPVANIRPEDFPGVFKDESRETEEGVQIVRFKTSHPPAEQEVSSAPTPTTSTTAKPEKATPFVRQDPPEEHSPTFPQEHEEPAFQPLSTTTEPPQMIGSTPMTMITTTAAAAAPPASEIEHDQPLTPQPPAPEQTSVLKATTYRPVMDDHEHISNVHAAAPIDAAEIVSSSTTVYPEIMEQPGYSNSSEPTSNVSSSPATPEAEGHFDDFNEYSQEIPDDQAAEEIARAQRLALAETLKRLREKQQNETVGNTEEEQEDNSLSSSEGRRPFMRRRLEVANLSLPTSAPIQNVNAVLDDGEGEHLSRDQIIEKIQRSKFRRVSTTTKRPRRVTRPSSSSTERTVPDLDQVDSYSDSSSSSTAGSVDSISATTTVSPSSSTEAPEEELSPTTPVLAPIMTTTQSTFSSSSSVTTLTSTTEAITTVEPTTTTTTEADPVMMTTASSRMTRRRTTTIPTTPSTTSTTEMTDFMEQDNEQLPDNRENDLGDVDVYYEEEVRQVQESSSSTTTTSTTTTETTMLSSSTEPTESVSSSTEAIFDVAMSSSTEPTEGSVSSSTTEVTTEETYSTTTTEAQFSVGTTAAPSTTIRPEVSATSATGQLIIHEILPTMPPLKEVSFVVGESHEDDQLIQTSDEQRQAEQPLPPVIRVEAKVSEIVEEQPSVPQTVNLSDEISEENIEYPLTSSEIIRNGRKVRVVIKRQRKVGGKSIARPSDTSADKTSSRGGEGRRRRRKVLRRPLPTAVA